VPGNHDVEPPAVVGCGGIEPVNRGPRFYFMVAGAFWLTP